MLTDREECSILLTQYSECLDWIRSYNSLIWQVPSLSMAINSFLVIAYLGYATTSLTRIFVLVIAFSFTFVSTIQLQKHRFFQEARLDEFNRLQEKLKTEYSDMQEIVFGTRDIIRTRSTDKDKYQNVKTGWIQRRIAFKWMTCLQYLSLLAIATLLAIEILLGVYSVWTACRPC